MRRTLLTAVLLAIIVPVHAAEFWNSLWRNADQQGEALMRQGDAGNAAKLYADPHRKAYAKIKAGDYQGAAKDLGELHDSEADYNRGNALAHTGDLQGAVAAYDAALKRDPNNQDAKHNRELVANALKQQPPQQSKSGDKQTQNGKADDKKDGEQGKGQDSSGADKQDDKNKQGEQSGQNKEGEQGKSSENKNEQKQSDKISGESSQQGKESKKSQQDNNQNGKSSDVNSQNARQAGQGKDSKQAAAKDDAEQARRDAEASLAKPAAEGKDGEGAADEMNAKQAMSANQIKSEKQIAQEQWLRSIPDDPGGLLRRKFLIEHMMRQQKAQQ